MSTLDETIEETPPKRKPGRPKGSKNKKKASKKKATRKPRKPAESTPEPAPEETPPEPENVQQEATVDASESAPSEYSDPFAEEVLPPPSERGKTTSGDPFSTPEENTSLELFGQGEGAGGALDPAEEKTPLGREKAEVLFTQFVGIYNALGAERCVRLLSTDDLEQLHPDEAKRIYEELVEVARLGETDVEILREPVVTRLSEMKVSKNTDLWIALGMVFGLKMLAIKGRTGEELQKAGVN